MDRIPISFVVAKAPDTQEPDYREISGQVLCSGPILDRRIYSISFKHNGSRWNATVGQPMTGSRPILRGRKQESDGFKRLSDTAIVRSIFAPHSSYTNGPFVVVTDGGTAAAE